VAKFEAQWAKDKIMTDKKSDLNINRIMKDTLAVILAGGRGSRLIQLSQSRSKPATPFGGKFRIIDFPLSNCINSGIRKIGVATQYKAHTLIQHLQNGWGFLRAELNEFVEIWPAQQQTNDGSWYRGTADAVFQNLNTIKEHNPVYVLVLAADHIYKQDYSRLIRHHVKSGADITVSCIEVPAQDATWLGVVDADKDGNIKGFVNKPDAPITLPGRPDTALASMGIYVFKAEFLYEQLGRDHDKVESTNDFSRDVMPYLVGRCKMIAHPFSNSCVITEKQTETYWRDIGTADAYWQANMDLTTVTPSLNLYDQDWPIWTLQAQLPAAKFVFDDDDRRGLAIDSVISSGCIISGGTVRRSLLFNNVRINSFCVVEDSVILPNGDVGRNATVKKAIIDVGSRIPDGLEIGVDPIADAKRFYVTPSGITIVTKSMLESL